MLWGEHFSFCWINSQYTVHLSEFSGGHRVITSGDCRTIHNVWAESDVIIRAIMAFRLLVLNRRLLRVGNNATQLKRQQFFEWRGQWSWNVLLNLKRSACGSAINPETYTSERRRVARGGRINTKRNDCFRKCVFKARMASTLLTVRQ